MRVLIAATLIALSGIGFPLKAEPHTVNFWSVKTDRCRPDTLSEVQSGCLVVENVDPRLLRQRDLDLKLELPGSRSVVASLTKSESVGRDAFIWRGTTQNATFSRIVFSDVNGVVVGTIAIDNRMYRLRLTMNKDYVVEELDIKRLPKHPSPPPPPPSPEPPPGDSERISCYDVLYPDPGGNIPDIPNCPRAHAMCDTDSPLRIDVAVLYTPEASSTAGGSDAISAWISLQLYLTNLSYIESNLAQQIHLVHSGEVTVPTQALLTTNPDAATCLDKLTRTCKPDAAHELRRRYNADIIALLVHSGAGGASGLSNPMDESHVRDHDDYVDFTDCAFSILDIGAFETGDYTFAHELGHVMGAQHNVPSQAGAIPSASFGYVDTTPSTQCGSWLTIMGERRALLCASCQRAPLWSNTDSDVKFCAETVGSVSAKNRDTLNHTAFTVANFYCGASVAKNVWIKDAWADTGTEPDPDTLAEPMWKSPYIWVRRTQDPPPYKNQHVNESPLVNKTNYVYVKVHNGGAEATGELQLWVAQAGTGLQWPGDFDAVGTGLAVTLKANRTEIFEFPWRADAYGSYAFVTRWESQFDPMAQPEGSDVEANARANNNIAWRNVGVVDLLTARDTNITTALRNIEKNPERIVILIRPSDPNPDHSIFKHARATIKLDPVLMAAWKDGGYRGKGFRRGLFRGIQIDDPRGVSLEGLVLKPDERSTVTVSVRDTRESPLRGTYLIDVIQRQQHDQVFRDVGGTTYEIHAIGR